MKSRNRCFNAIKTLLPYLAQVENQGGMHLITRGREATSADGNPAPLKPTPGHATQTTNAMTGSSNQSTSQQPSGRTPC